MWLLQKENSVIWRWIVLVRINCDNKQHQSISDLKQQRYIFLVTLHTRIRTLFLRCTLGTRPAEQPLPQRQPVPRKRAWGRVVSHHLNCTLQHRRCTYLLHSSPKASPVTREPGSIILPRAPLPSFATSWPRLLPCFMINNPKNFQDGATGRNNSWLYESWSPLILISALQLVFLRPILQMWKWECRGIQWHTKAP